MIDIQPLGAEKWAAAVPHMSDNGMMHGHMGDESLMTGRCTELQSVPDRPVASA